MDLGRLLQDEVVVQIEGAGHLDGQGDAHGGHRHHQLGPGRGQALGQLLSGALGEAHAQVDADEQGDGAVVGDRHEGQAHPLGADAGAVGGWGAHDQDSRRGTPPVQPTGRGPRWPSVLTGPPMGPHVTEAEPARGGDLRSERWPHNVNLS